MQEYTGKQLRCFPLNTVLAPPPATGFGAAGQDLGSEAEDEDRGSSSSDDDEDGSSSSESDATDDVSEAERQENVAAARTPRSSRRSGMEVKVAAPPLLPKMEAAEVKKDEEPKLPPRRVDELRPHAVCKMCQVGSDGDVNFRGAWNNDTVFFPKSSGMYLFTPGRYLP